MREAIAPMRLGLWMAPLHFHPSSETYKQHPEWICHPIGDGLLAYNTAEPESSSNEAGIVTWGPDALPHIEARLTDAIENWGVRYFKWDFMAWLDCAGQGDIYTFREALLAMLDRLQAKYPDVTFQIDETNDYRLFPYESVARGPSWFQNGSPEYDQLLHNLWNLSPYVPAWSLGQHFLGGQRVGAAPGGDADGGRAPLPPHVLQRPAPSCPTRSSTRRGRGSTSTSAAASCFTQLTYPLLADPLEQGWTALQSWNPERGRRRAARLPPAGRARRRSRSRCATCRAGQRFELLRGPERGAGRHGRPRSSCARA